MINEDIDNRQKMANKMRYVFIVGASRSGTTMLSRALGSHDKVCGLEELHFFEGLWSPDDEPEIAEEEALGLAGNLLWIQRKGYLTKWNSDYFKDDAEKIVHSCVTENREKNLSPMDVYKAFMSFEADANGKAIVCEQTPKNLFYLEEIFRSFENAKIIFMVRDPRDVLLSQKNRWKRKKFGGGHRYIDMLRDWINYHPVVIAQLWKTAFSAYSRWNSDARVMLVQYEKLVFKPQKELLRVCNFIGLEFSDSMLNVPYKGSSNSRDKENNGFDDSRIGVWNKGGLNAAEIKLCEKICFEGMKVAGYPESGKKLQPLILYYYATLPWRFALAVAFNIHRVKSIRLAISRRLRTCAPRGG